MSRGLLEETCVSWTLGKVGRLLQIAVEEKNHITPIQMNEIASEEASSTDDEYLSDRSYLRQYVVRRVYYDHCKCTSLHNEHR